MVYKSSSVDVLDAYFGIRDRILIREELEADGYDVPKGAVGWQQAHDGPSAKWWIMGVRGIKCSTWSAPTVRPWNGSPRFLPIISLHDNNQSTRHERGLLEE